MDKIEPNTEYDIPIEVDDYLKKYSLEEIWEAYLESRKTGRGSRFLETIHDLREERERIKVTLPLFLIDALRIIREKALNSMRLATCLITKVGIINIDNVFDPTLSGAISELMETKKVLRKLNTLIDLEDNVILSHLWRKEPLWRYFAPKRSELTRRDITVYYWAASRISNFADTLGLTLDDAARIVLCIGLYKSGSNGNKGYIPKVYIKKIYDYLNYLKEEFNRENEELEKKSIKRVRGAVESDLISMEKYFYNFKNCSLPLETKRPQSVVSTIRSIVIGGVIGGDLKEKLQELAQELKEGKALRENIEELIIKIEELENLKKKLESSISEGEGEGEGEGEAEGETTQGKFDEETIRQFYRFLNHPKGTFTEIRGIDPNQNTYPAVFFVDNEDDFLNACRAINGRLNVYVGVNPRKRKSGKREDIAGVSVIPFDIDPVGERPSNEEQLKASLKVATQISSDWARNFSSSPVIIMTGNGHQLLKAIPYLEVNDENRSDVEYCLFEFQYKTRSKYAPCINFSTDACPMRDKISSPEDCKACKEYTGTEVKIDNIGDLARIIKVPGTKSIKGKPTPERPHRYSYALTPLNRVEDSEFLKGILSAIKIRKTVEEEKERFRVDESEGKAKPSPKDVIDLDALKKSYKIEDYVRIPKDENREKEQIMAFCPFHADEHPSFSINTKKQLWYCFACNVGGSIIDFVMVKENCDVSEAIRKLKEGWRG